MKNIKEEIQQWEDSKNIKPKKKNSKLNEDGIRNIIGKTKKRSIERIEKDTGKTKIKTTEDFLQQLKDKGHYNENYDYSKVEYKGIFIKIIVIDKKFNSEHKILPVNLLHKNSKCLIVNAIDKNKYFLDKLKDLNKINNKYDYSKIKYVNSQSKVVIIDKESNTEHLFSPDQLLSRNIKCSINNAAEPNKLFIKKSIKIHGSKYDYSNFKYIYVTVKGKIKCKKCGDIFEQTPTNHLNGHGCFKCAVEKRAKLKTYSINEFIEMANKVHGDKYDYNLVNYINCETKVKIKCNECNSTFYQSPSKHLDGQGCKICGYKRVSLINSLTTKEIIEKFTKVHGCSYDYSLVEYEGAKKKVKIICNDCGSTFKQIAYEHLRGLGCNICNKSIGERKIRTVLNSLNIFYETQKTFNGCKNKRKLFFDFYLPECNLLIEYNGLQHYEPMGYFGGLEKHEYQIKNDKIKKDYCNQNNINLLIIPYTEFNNIEKIIKNKYENSMC